MTESWDSVKDLVAEVQSLPPEERARAIARLCGDDAVLEARVLRLLELAEQAGRQRLP